MNAKFFKATILASAVMLAACSSMPSSTSTLDMARSDFEARLIAADAAGPPSVPAAALAAGLTMSTVRRSGSSFCMPMIES